MIQKLTTLTDDARNGLTVALGGYDAQYAHEIETGISECFAIDNGFLITRVEQAIDRAPELVACCVEGVPVKRVAPLLINAALNMGAESIRAHTTRPGIGRMMRQWGDVQKEYVFTLNLKGGRYYGQ